MKKIKLYLAMSLDGYIAGEDGDMSFLERVHIEGEDYGYADFVSTIDTVIVGRRTYDWVMTQVDEFPHKDKKCFIISRTYEKINPNLEYYNGSLNSLIKELKAKEGKDVFVDGGAQVIDLLLQDDLIDEFHLSIIPTILGKGTRLFSGNESTYLLEHVKTQSFNSGLVQISYRRKREI